uniref:Uncharacterized protein LOC110198696 n=1 Tax=Phascolarctos cinereus TaxID=38626 RepID=A0A6P5J3A9_PHACI|nr:uncharacterized protein LOC110198696 [Phascolarctos cinereus]
MDILRLDHGLPKHSRQASSSRPPQRQEQAKVSRDGEGKGAVGPGPEVRRPGPQGPRAPEQAAAPSGSAARPDLRREERGNWEGGAAPWHESRARRGGAGPAGEGGGHISPHCRTRLRGPGARPGPSNIGCSFPAEPPGSRTGGGGVAGAGGLGGAPSPAPPPRRSGGCPGAEVRALRALGQNHRVQSRSRCRRLPPLSQPSCPAGVSPDRQGGGGLSVRRREAPGGPDPRAGEGGLAGRLAVVRGAAGPETRPGLGAKLRRRRPRRGGRRRRQLAPGSAGGSSSGGGGGVAGGCAPGASRAARGRAQVRVRRWEWGGGGGSSRRAGRALGRGGPARGLRGWASGGARSAPGAWHPGPLGLARPPRSGPARLSRPGSALPVRSHSVPARKVPAAAAAAAVSLLLFIWGMPANSLHLLSDQGKEPQWMLFASGAGVCLRGRGLRVQLVI